MVISSDFRMGEHRDDDHEEDAPYFMFELTYKLGRVVRMVVDSILPHA